MARHANLTEGLRFRIVLRPGVAIGPGKADLLQAIAELASLTAAAERCGMSYKRCWTLVQELNAAFATRLVETIKGGVGGGGGTRLTPLGHRVLERYRQMQADAEKVIAEGVADLKSHLKPDAGAPADPPAGGRPRRRRGDD